MTTGPESISYLLRKVSLLDYFSNGVELISEHVQSKDAPVVLSFINAHGFNLAYKDPGFCDALLGSDILLRDGIGMALLFRKLQVDPAANFCGTDFIPFLLEHCAGKKVALLGTRTPYLQQAANRLEHQGAEVVLCMDGFREPAEYVSAVADAKPDVVLLGMGMPKQEKVALLMKQQLLFPCLLINGGACIDYLGGKVPRAPQWMRQYGLEWLYRLLLEPQRMFGRYVIGNVLFLARLLTIPKQTLISYKTEPIPRP
jgi:exopolysaccharide biosynthesis WecB/TagA/CpsF family protein